MEPKAGFWTRALAIGLAVALPLTAPGGAFVALAAAEPLAGAAGTTPQQAPAPAFRSNLDPRRVMEYLDAQGVFKGPQDPLRSYMIDRHGAVTPMGDAAFRYFVARPKEVKAFDDAFEKLRESGPLNDQKAVQIQQALQGFTDQFGDIGSGGSAEDAHGLGGRLHSLILGAQQPPSQSADELAPGSAGYVQVDRGDAFEFHDKDGLLIKTTKPTITPEGDRAVREVMTKLGQPLPPGEEIDVPSALAILQAAGVISGPEDPRAKQYFNEGGMQTWNRQIEEQQRAMNAARPPNAPLVTVNGRYHKEMFEWNYWSMRQQVEETKLQLKVDRMARLAELLGKQFRDDQWYKDPKLEATLLREAKNKTFSQLWITNRGAQFDAACGGIVQGFLKRQAQGEKIENFLGSAGELQEFLNGGGKVRNYLDLVHCKLLARFEVVKNLEDKLGLYKTRVDAFGNTNFITQQQFMDLSRSELLVRKYVTLSWLEGQRWRADAQVERLDFSAPDHEALKKAIEDSGMSRAEKDAYHQRALDILQRVQRLKKAYDQISNTLNTADFATALERVQGMLAQTQKELGDAEIDFRIWSSMPGLSKTTEDEDTGLINGAWRWTSQRLNVAHNYWSNGMKFDSDDSKYLQGRYLKNRDALAGYRGAFTDVSRLIAAGKWEEARQRLIAADPRAIQTHGRDMSLRGGEIQDSDRLEAVFRKVGESVQHVSNQHIWVNMVGQFVMWSVATAVFAPAAGALLSGMSRVAFATATRAAASSRTVVRAGGFFAKAAGEIFDHSAVRLIALSPHVSKVRSEWGLLSRIGIKGAPIRILDATAKRTAITMARIGAFTGMAGSISGGFTAVNHMGEGLSEGTLMHAFAGGAAGAMASKVLPVNPLVGLAIGAGAGTVIAAGRDQGWNAVFDGSAAQRVWTGGESAFQNPFDAGLQGAKMGAKWSLESWHPLLGMGFGLPSSVFEGRRFTGPLSENLASRGTVGLGLKTIDATTAFTHGRWKLTTLTGGLAGCGAGYLVGGEDGALIGCAAGGALGGAFSLVPKLRLSAGMDEWMQAAVKSGGRGAAGATSLGLADNISKYMIFSHGIGGVAHFASWQLNAAEADNLERRIKRAHMAEQEALMAPYWLMLPVFPARLEQMSAMSHRQTQGENELRMRGELDVLANAAEGQQVHLLGKQEVPVIQRIFQWNPWAEEGSFGTYTVTKDMKYRAIREILPSEITGKVSIDPKTGKSLIDASAVNPREYLRVSRMPNEDGKVTKVGRLALGDEVRDQAAALFEEAIIKRTDLAAKILDPKNLGRDVEGFGYVRPEHAEEVARVLYRHAKEIGLMRPDGEGVGLMARLREKLPGSAETTELVKLMPKVNDRLGPYLQSESNVVAKARELLETLGRTKKTSAEFNDVMNGMIDRTTEWRVNNESNAGHADTKIQWNELVGEFRNDARWKAARERLGPAEREIIVKTLDYFDAIQSRFTTFNKVEITHGRMLELLQARRSEAQGQGDRALARGLDRMLTELNGWKKGERAPDVPVQGEGATLVPDPAKPGKQTTAYNAMLYRLRQGIEKDPALGAAERESLMNVLGELDAAPWLLHDSKGAALPGWRPGQFEALMTFVGGINTGGGKGAEVIRVFQMLKTGGGKTMLAYEGILPIADADAAMRGGKKVVFLTVLSNLEAQARMEFRGYKKLTTEMQIDTWENHKTKIATGKTRGRGGADDYWIIGDEMDGAALQPALTIGETTAYVSKEHPAYRNMKGGIEKVERLLTGEARDLGQKLRFEGNRQKTILEGMKAQDPHLTRALGEGAERLLRLGEKLQKARGTELGEVRAQVETILDGQLAILDATTAFGAGSPRFVEAQGRLARLAEDIGQAKSAKTLTGKLGEAKTAINEQLAELSVPEMVKSAQTQALRPALLAARQEIDGALAALGGKAKGGKGAPTVQSRATTAADGLRRLGSEQQSVLRSGTRRDAAQLNEFADASKVIRDAAMDTGGGKAVDSKGFAQNLRKLMSEQNNVMWRAEFKSGSKAPKQVVDRLRTDSRQKQHRANALRSSDPAEAAKLDGEVATLEAQLAALESRGKAMDWLKKNGEDMIATAEKGSPGWEGRVRDLALRRRAVLETTLEHENPIYTIFAKMKERMYPLYASKLRTQNDARMRMEAPERMEQGGAKQREALVERLESWAQRLESRKDPGAAAARELVVKARTELEGWRSGQQVRKAIESKEPAKLKSAREAWEKASEELARIDSKIGETSGRIDRSFADAKVFREKAATAKPKQAAELTQRADAAEAQAKQSLGELSGFRREAELKNVAARELLAKFMEQNQAFLKEQLPEVVQSFEKGAAENAEAWQAALKEKGFDASALRARYRELNAQASQTADPKVASKLRSQAVQVENDIAALEAVTAELSARPQIWRTEGQRLKMDSDAALKAHFTRIDGVSTSELGVRAAFEATGLPYGVRLASRLAAKVSAKVPALQWPASKLSRLAETTPFRGIDESALGLTRAYAGRLLHAVATDPFIPPASRWQLMWNILPSAIWPRGFHYHSVSVPVFGLVPKGFDALLGVTPSGETWVRRELFNLARGYTDNPATERFDNGTKKVNAVHNGQWFETMDTPTRRFWELHYGTDLTLPYEHKAIVTMNDFVRDNPNVRMVGLSGTAGGEFRKYLRENNVRLSGDRLASTGAKDLSFDVYSSPTGKYQAILDALNATKETGGLVVLSLPDTRTLKTVRDVLTRSGLKDDQIAQVFSDAELLRVNNPAANVSKQTNLHNLTTGRVKVLMLDTRVGGRGLDLNFKGVRGGSDPNAFRGYNKMEMLIVDPQDMTSVHNIQAQGRIDLGRVNPGTVRNFRLVMDVRLAQRDPVFMDMVNAEPRFARLKQDAAVRAISLRNGRVTPEWSDIHEHILTLEGRGERRDLTVPYRDIVKDYLTKKQGEVELDQLRGASVKQDRPAFNPLMRGLEGWAR